jgi:hypothetical protein
MSAKRWLGSPLAGTAGVLAGLCLLVIPLRQLTSAPPLRPAVPTELSVTEMPAVLRVKLLAPAKRLLVKTTDGEILLDMPSAPAGETEHEVVLPLADGGLDLALTADFGGSLSETAVFLTVLPDGLEELTRHAIGSGMLEETLRFEWHHEH